MERSINCGGVPIIYQDICSPWEAKQLALSMPPGTPHHSFLLPYRIRVDDFTTPRDQHFEPPALNLLSHTHSDHTTGLSARSFGAQVVCSFDAKHMLLNSETVRDRIAFDMGEMSEKRKPYAHLKINPLSSTSKNKTFSRDLLVNIYIFSRERLW